MGHSSGAARGGAAARVLVVNVSDQRGGAARAALRLSMGLKNIGLEVQMAVQHREGNRHWTKRSESAAGRLLSKSLGTLDKLPNRLLHPGTASLTWSNNWYPHKLLSGFDLSAYDLIHFHWVGGGYVPISSLSKMPLPVVWTLHDMWPFTGGCHYSGDCNGYQASCGNCPQLGSRSSRDLSAYNLRSKRRALAKRSVRVVSPSNWLAGIARQSALFGRSNVSVIPNGLDLDVYRPVPKDEARRLLNLPMGRKLILFGAASATRDTRKGFPQLCSAIRELARNSSFGDDAELIVFGAETPQDPLDLGVPVRFLGELADDYTLAAVYSAADVLVAPSLQENLANTIMEGLACGTPAVAFDIGGNGDLIDHLQTGYLATAFDPTDLAAGIRWALDQAPRDISAAARRTCVERFELGVVARRYAALFDEALGAHSTAGMASPQSI